MSALATFAPTIKLSKAGKMPCQSYSIPAQECQMGSKLRKLEGSTCSKCYAHKGNYRFKNVKASREHNYNHVMACQHDADMRADWIQQLTDSLLNDRYFRWHDSGDIQGTWHLDMIVAVAEASPHCKFWLPTREHGMIKEWLASNREGFPSNLVVRLSAHMMGKAQKVTEAQASKGVAASTVACDEGTQCPAYTRDGKCGACRACWDRSVASVNYPLH